MMLPLGITAFAIIIPVAFLFIFAMYMQNHTLGDLEKKGLQIGPWLIPFL